MSYGISPSQRPYIKSATNRFSKTKNSIVDGANLLLK